MTEIFKKIFGYENYEISNFGNVKNSKGKIMKTRKNKCGYEYVQLSKNKKNKIFTIHRLIAIYFIDNANGLKYVDHLNGIKDDNRIVNLRWCDASENACNRSISIKTNTSGIKNIHFSNVTQKWRLKITKNKKTFLKEFNTFEEALNLRDKYLIEFHKKFAKKNK